MASGSSWYYVVTVYCTIIHTMMCIYCTMLHMSSHWNCTFVIMWYCVLFTCIVIQNSECKKRGFSSYSVAQWIVVHLSIQRLRIQTLLLPACVLLQYLNLNFGLTSDATETFVLSSSGFQEFESWSCQSRAFREKGYNFSLPCELQWHCMHVDGGYHILLSVLCHP